MHEELNPTGARRALEEIASQRRELAERIRPPGWYMALSAGATLGLFVVPALAVRPHHHLPWSAVPAVIVLATLVLSMSSTVVGRRAGARLTRDQARGYPASRTRTLVAITIVAMGSAATWIAATTVSWVASLVVGLVSAVLLFLAQSRVLAAIRSDVGSGRAVRR